MLDEKDLLGGKVFFVDDEKCYSIGSRKLNQSDIEYISKIEGVAKILFYCIIFDSVDFSVFKNSTIKQFTFLHGNFSGKNLKDVCNITSLKILQILDAKVSDTELIVAKSYHPNIIFK